MSTRAEAGLSSRTWLEIVADAFTLFDDAEARGFGTPPFSPGGGTVLMLRFRHRLSEGVDLFDDDAIWLSVLSPRLNAVAAGLAIGHAEQANGMELVTPRGDMDLVIAGDGATPVDRTVAAIAGRDLDVDPTSEILAKRLFYRAAGFKPRDVYDPSATLDLAPEDAARAVDAALPQADILLRGFAELRRLPPSELLAGIVPYGARLDHADSMLDKVEGVVRSRRGFGGPSASGGSESKSGGRHREVFARRSATGSPPRSTRSPRASPCRRPTSCPSWRRAGPPRAGAVRRLLLRHAGPAGRHAGPVPRPGQAVLRPGQGPPRRRQLRPRRRGWWLVTDGDDIQGGQYYRRGARRPTTRWTIPFGETFSG